MDGHMSDDEIGTDGVGDGLLIAALRHRINTLAAEGAAQAQEILSLRTQMQGQEDAIAELRHANESQAIELAARRPYDLAAAEKAMDETDARNDRTDADYEAPMNEAYEEILADLEADKPFSLAPTFSAAKFIQVCPFPILVEALDKKLAGRVRRAYDMTFTEQEQRLIREWTTKKFRRWHLHTGMPDKVVIRLSTLRTLRQGIEFFATI